MHAYLSLMFDQNLPLSSCYQINEIHIQPKRNIQRNCSTFRHLRVCISLYIANNQSDGRICPTRSNKIYIPPRKTILDISWKTVILDSLERSRTSTQPYIGLRKAMLVSANASSNIAFLRQVYLYWTTNHRISNNVILYFLSYIYILEANLLILVVIYREQTNYIT